MSMYPKIQKTIHTSDGYTKNIETMGDTTHVMVNHFCYHVRQLPEGELKDACTSLLEEAKAMGEEPEPRRGIMNMDGTIEYFTGEY